MQPVERTLITGRDLFKMEARLVHGVLYLARVLDYLDNFL